jgi:hypothetical protein
MELFIMLQEQITSSARIKIRMIRVRIAAGTRVLSLLQNVLTGTLRPTQPLGQLVSEILHATVFHQQIELTFKEESSKVLHLEHSFVWR